MAWSENLSRMNAAVFPEVGDRSTWEGVAGDVWVVIRGGDTALDMGQAQAMALATFLEVQVAQVPSPRKGHAVTVAGVAYKVVAKPQLSDDRSVWICEAAKV